MSWLSLHPWRRPTAPDENSSPEPDAVTPVPTPEVRLRASDPESRVSPLPVRSVNVSELMLSPELRVRRPVNRPVPRTSSPYAGEVVPTPNEPVEVITLALVPSLICNL